MDYTMLYLFLLGLALGAILVYLYLTINSAGTLYIDSSDGVTDIFRLDLTMDPEKMKKRSRKVMLYIDPHADLSRKNNTF